MKRLIAIGCLALSLGSTWAWADLGSGLSALDRSDYATALKELQPLAEQGNVQAQTSVGKIYLYLISHNVQQAHLVSLSV